MTDRISVALDVSAIPSDPRGAGRYVLDLVRALAERDRVDLELLARRGDGARWSSLAPGAAVHALVPPARPLRLLWEQVAAARAVSAWPVGLYHGPHYTMPAGLRLPRVVTVHDLTFFDHPEWHERGKVAFFRRAIRTAAARADALVCVSEATRRRLIELLAPAGPVHAIPHGVDHARFRPDPQPTDAAVRNSLGAAGPYLLFVGTLEPRKNVAGLVAAFDRVAADRADLGLVLAGGPGWGDARLAAAIDASRHRDRIVRTGYVPDHAVPALIRGAAAVVYPAFVEGFGLPVLEALACGVPVVTTAGSVMDQTAGGAAVVATAGDQLSLVAAIETVLDDPAGNRVRRAQGLATAAAHTWAATAEAHEQVYASVVAGC